MPEFTNLWAGGPGFAQSEHFKMGTDSILLGDFTQTASARRGIDLGCGSGILGILLLCKSERLHMTGLEIIPEAAELARANMEENGLSPRSDIRVGDIREHRSLFPAGGFDLVVANPPYFALGSGAASPKSGRDSARGELCCSLEELCAAAAFLLRTGGSFSLVHRPERLSELLCLLSAKGMEPKRLRLVCHRPAAPPSLVLIEARRGGRPGLKVEPVLFLCHEDGSESAEYRRIYHR